MKTSSLALLAACLLSGCGDFLCSLVTGVSQTVQAATATHLAVVTVLQSPPVPGVPGIPTLSGASVFFGNRPTETTLQPAPITGGEVAIADTAGLTVTAAETGDGFYVSTSLDGGFRYDQGAVYTFTLTDDAGVSYTLNGTAPPPEQVPQLSASVGDDGGFPEAIFAQTTAGSSFTLTRTAPASGGQLNVAFVAVFSIVGSGASSSPTWTNLPQTPLDYLNLIANDAEWRTQTVVIPGSAFPTAGLYLVTLTAVQRGAATSDNMFSGSPVLLGAGTAGVIDVR